MLHSKIDIFVPTTVHGSRSTGWHVATEFASCLSETIPYQIAADYFGNLVWTVLMHGMTTACQDLHLEATLHLSNGQCAIQAIDAGEQ